MSNQYTEKFILKREGRLRFILYLMESTEKMNFETFFRFTILSFQDWGEIVMEYD